MQETRSTILVVTLFALPSFGSACGSLLGADFDHVAASSDDAGRQVDGRSVSSDDGGATHDRLDTKVDRLETNVDRLDTKVDRLETKVDVVDAKVEAHRAETDAHRAETRKGFADLDEELTKHPKVHRELEKDVETLKRRPPRSAARPARRRAR